MLCRRAVLRLAALASVALIAPSRAQESVRSVVVAFDGDHDDLASLCRTAGAVVGVTSAIAWIEGDALASTGDEARGVRLRGWEAGSVAGLAAVIGPISAGRADRLDDVRALLGGAVAEGLGVGVDGFVTLVTPTDPFPTDIRLQVGGILQGDGSALDAVVVYVSGATARQLLPNPARAVVAAVLEPGANPVAVARLLAAAMPQEAIVFP